jgi:hypothetical protein
MSIDRDNTPLNQREWSEKRLEQAIRDLTKEQGGFAMKLSSPSKNGVPDREIILPGDVHFYVETKRWGRNPSALQFRTAATFLRMGHHFYFIDNLLDYTAVLYGARSGNWESSSYRAPPGAQYKMFYEDLFAKGVSV